MRNLIHMLADEKKYTFRTLTRRQLTAVMDETKDIDKELTDLRKKESDKGLSAKEYERIVVIEKLQMDVTDKIIRLSLSHSHPEFAYTDNDKHNDGVNDKLSDLIDLRDIGIISNFAMSGTLPKEDGAETINTGDIVI